MGGLVQVVLRGRSEAMGLAVRVLRETRADGGSAVLSVTGPPGIGKTTVLDAVLAEAMASGFRVGFSKAEEVGQVAPGLPLFMALRSGRQPLVAAEQVAAWEALDGRPLDLVEPLSNGLELLAVRTPVVVAVDDVQWADPMSRTLLRALIGRLAGSAIVWLLSVRSGGAEVLADVTALAGADVPVHRVELGPLAVDDLIRIATDRLGEDLSAAVRRMLESVGGNPLVALQVIESAAQARRRGEPDELVPTEFILATRERRDRLDPEVADLVDLASVLGRPFTLAELAELAELTEVTDLADAAGPAGLAVSAAIEADILRRDGDVISFTHDLMRETIHAGIPDGRRRALHLRCANHLLAAGADLLVVAAHVRSAARPGDAESAALLRRAAASAVSRMPQAAAALSLDALGLLRPSQPEWIVTAEECVDILGRAEHLADAVRVAERALSRDTDPERRARLHVGMARALFSMGKADEAVRRLEVALEDRRMSRTAQARLAAALALALTRVGQAARAREGIARATELAHELDDRDALLTALRARGELARASGHHGEAVQAYQDLRRLDDEQPFVAEEVLELQLLDRYDESARLLEKVRAEAVREVPAPVLWAQMWHDFNLCRLEEAELGARQLIGVCRELGGHVLEVDAYVVLSSVALLRGDPASARDLVHRCEATCRTDDLLRHPSLRLQYGWIAAADGRADEAMSILRHELATAHESRVYWPWWPGWMPLLTHFGLMARDPEFVRACVHLADEGAVRNPGVAGFEGLALHVRGLTSGDVTTLREAVRVLTRSPRPELAAYALADLGRALLREGAAAEGAECLDQAWDVYAGLGMDAPMTAIQRVMRQAGLRRSKWDTAAGPKPTSGWEALTPTEQRVAQLISSGRTNRAAAEQLGVSANTVGTHLRAIFEKLGVHSRVQLANLHQHHRGPAGP